MEGGNAGSGRPHTIGVAAYQAPLLGSAEEALQLIREQIESCERAGVRILCCPEAVLGGLADHARRPEALAIAGARLDEVLQPLASDEVTTIIGFTELGSSGRLYNSAAVYYDGVVLGVHRKLHPAIRTSVYAPGQALPVFTVHGLTFGVLICRDASFPDPARLLAERGARALFVPTNNALAPERGGPGLVRDARADDVARATDNDLWIVRADVAGRGERLVSYGSSAIVGPDGHVRTEARPLEPDLIVWEIDGVRSDRSP